MATKNPFDPSEFFNAYDQDAIKKIFDPQNMFAAFTDGSGTEFDLQSVAGATKKNLEALTEANMTAISTYRELFEKQMAVFEQLTQAARQQAERLEPTGDAGAVSRNAKVVSEAVEQAFQVMQEMAESATEANTKVLDNTKERVNEAIAKMKQD